MEIYGLLSQQITGLLIADISNNSEQYIGNWSHSTPRLSSETQREIPIAIKWGFYGLYVELF